MSLSGLSRDLGETVAFFPNASWAASRTTFADFSVDRELHMRRNGSEETHLDFQYLSWWQPTIEYSALN